MVMNEIGEPIGERVRLPTPKRKTPPSDLKTIRRLAKLFGRCHRVSVGFPGTIRNGVILTATNRESKYRGTSHHPGSEQITTDLGSSRRTMDLALTQGDPIVVAGSWEDVGPYSVLMAQQIRTEAKRVSLNRQIGTTAGERTVEGRIQQFRNIRMNRVGEVHRAAAVQTRDGRMALVDLGPDNQDRTPLRAGAGDRMVAHGPVVQVHNYPVLWANRVAIKDGMPVDVTRSSGPTEFLPGTGNRSENCLGAGCDNQPLNQGQSGRSNSNAMDGTTR